MKFFSDISIWWLIPWAIFCIVAGIWYYRRQKGLEEVSRLIKSGLIALRSSVLFLLGLLLLGLLLEAIDYKTQKPVLITLTDNSSSMLNYKDSSKVKSEIDQFKQQMAEMYGDRFDIVHFTTGNGVIEGNPTFKDQLSNLDEGFERIYTQFYNQNIGGICFFSDGNFNKGKNPKYTAEKISLTPIFSVGVGDTVQKRDQAIQNVSVNDIAFYRNQFPIEIDIQAAKMGKAASEVVIYRNGKRVASEALNYEDGTLDIKQVSLMLDANEIGFIQYRVELKYLDNESTYENNAWSFYVEVIDSRSKILMLSKAPHPDIAAIKNVVERDENVEVKSQLVSEWDGKLDEYALLIWHDPGTRSNNALLNAIKKTKIPVWYIVGSRTSPAVVDQLGVSVKLPRGNRSDEAQAAISSGFQLFEISDDLKASLSNWPPLNVPFGKISGGKGSVLLNQRIGPVTKKDPLFVFGTGDQKYGVLIGEGIWRWKLSEYAKTKGNKGFNELVQKSVQYLLVKKNTDALRVNMPKRFNRNEDVIINAEFYNSSFERITKPSILFKLKDDKGKVVDYEFAKGKLDYKLVLGKLNPGKYDWSASASYDGKSYAKTGVFVVSDISMEQVKSNADHNLLSQIAENSNGKFYRLAQSQQLLKDIGARKDIVNISYEESTFRDVIDYKWLFFLAIVLLGLEWFFRRRLGIY